MDINGFNLDSIQLMANLDLEFSTALCGPRERQISVSENPIIACAKPLACHCDSCVLPS